MRCKKHYKNKLLSVVGVAVVMKTKEASRLR